MKNTAAPFFEPMKLELLSFFCLSIPIWIRSDFESDYFQSDALHKSSKFWKFW